MRAQALSFIVAATYCTSASAELLDPRERDETISATDVSVSVTQTDSGLYRYSYTLVSDGANKGKVRMFGVNLKCDQDFSGYEQPELDSGRSGRGVANPGEPPRFTPSIAGYDYEEGAFGISRSRQAMWGVRLEPGESRNGMYILSPLEPGMREYTLEPAMPTGNYDYDSLPDDITSDDLPQVSDFRVTGMIEGPTCPGVSPPPESPRFEGASPRSSPEPEGINRLLTYSAPLQDRLTVPADQDSLTITVHYHERIDPSTFRVQPAWARRLFNAEPGASETVELPIRGPHNRFQLEVHPEKSEQPRSEDDWHHSYKEMDVFEVRVDGHPGNENGNSQRGQNAR